MTLLLKTASWFYLQFEFNFPKNWLEMKSGKTLSEAENGSKTK